MKKVFKFTMAALAATVLASCSTDDFSDFGGGKGQLKKGDLVVKVEGMQDASMTRAAILPTNDGTGSLFWQEGDKIFAYDQALTAYDTYEFDQKNGFEQTLKELDNLAAVEYAVYVGSDKAPKNTWYYKTNDTRLLVQIPQRQKWAEETVYDKDGKKETAYMSLLPMWGTAKKNDEGKVETTLRYLTGVLRVDLENVPNNANYLYVRGWQGREMDVPARMVAEGNEYFEAQIRHDDFVDQWEKGIKLDAALDPESTTLTTSGYDNNWIEVDIRSAKKEKSTVFIPIIQQDYTNIQLAYSETAVSGTAALGTLFKTNEIWSTKKEYPEMTSVRIERGKYYSAAHTFDIAGLTINEINKAIEKAINGPVSGRTVKIKATNVTSVGTYDGEVLKLPVAEDVDKYEIELQGLTGSTVSGALKVEAPVRKNNLDIVLNMAGTNGCGQITKLYINAPTANVMVKGNWGGVTLGDRYEEGTSNATGGTGYVRYAPNSLVVGTLTVGDVKNCVYKNGRAAEGWDKDYNNNPLTKVAGVYVNNETEGKITIAYGANVNGDLKLDGQCGVTEVVVNGKVTGEVDGTLEGKLSTNAAQKVNVTLGGESAEGVEYKNAEIGTLKTNQTEFSIKGTSHVGTATCAGAVYIERTADGEAVGTLNMLCSYYKAAQRNDEMRTLTLKGGYIKKLNTSAKIVLENTEARKAAPTAFLRGTCSIEDYKSTWMGGDITDPDYKNKNEINTAAQLKWLKEETKTPAKEYTLMCDLDMKENPIKPLDNLWYTFNGNGKTISNLRVEGEAGKPAGLFGKYTGLAKGLVDDTNEGAVKNLILYKPVVIGNGEAGTGILFGQINRRVSVTGVTIIEGSVESKPTTGKKDENNVGGLVGKMLNNAEDTLFITKVEVDCGTIKGRYNLGGLVGYATRVIGEENTVKTAGFQVLLPTYIIPTSLEDGNDVNYGSVGKYCGYLETSMDMQNSDFGAAMTLAERVNYGFLLHNNGRHYNESTSQSEVGAKYPEDGGNYYWYGSTSGIVGIADPTGTVKIGNRTYTNKNSGGMGTEPENESSAANMYVVNAALRSKIYLKDPKVKEALGKDKDYKWSWE